MDSSTQHLDDLQIKIRRIYERIRYWIIPIWCLKRAKKKKEAQITVIIRDNVSVHFKNESSERQWERHATCTCWLVSAVQEWVLQRKQQESLNMLV